MFCIAFNHLLQEKTEKRRVHFIFKVGPVSSETRPVVLSLLEVFITGLGDALYLWSNALWVHSLAKTHSFTTLALPTHVSFSLAPIWPPIHQQKPECTNSPGGGITGYFLSDMTFELKRKLVDGLSPSPTLGATGPPLSLAQQHAKSPHSDWTHRKAGPFNAKHRRMFYSTERAVEPFYCVIQ